ncbi:MAG: DUF6125 family protein [Actinomycetota bacterium]|nr:DUF6125 family protein [Actinomycetota bacterium]MDD5667823.1 DUF6125 family protein [Actinomycetota bacterium]
MHITEEQMQELRLGALTAIDGLWFMAVEEKYGFDTALELDLEVWKNYGRVLLKRISRMLGLAMDPEEPIDLATVNLLMETVCHVDGTQCGGEVGDGEIVFRVHRCSWWDNLSRSGRESHVPCEFVDNTIFRDWLEYVDPTLSFEITHSLPRGDDHCEWVIGRRITEQGRE